MRFAIQAHALAEMLQHANADASSVLATHGDMELRVCGSGPEAYFEWVSRLGDPVGQVATVLTVTPSQ